MARAIPRPMEKDFRLERYDPDGDASVTIRQATQGAHERRSMLWASLSRVFQDNDPTGQKMEIKQEVSFEEVKRIEVMLTLRGCNIPHWDGPQLFRFKKAENGSQYLAMSEAEFTAAWSQIPPELAEEIHEKVLEMNPQWSNRGEAP